MGSKALFLGGLVAGNLWAAGSELIRLNQVGYVVGEPKIAISLELATATASLVDSATGTAVFQPTLSSAQNWSDAGESGRVVDFGAFDKPGTYLLKIGTETSHPIHIASNPYTSLTRAAIKAFWYNRSSYALPAQYAGPWARAAGHPDVDVVVHPSAASAARPKGTKIRSPGGWYDAGDYNKYVVNSGISTWTLLHLYEEARPYFDTLRLNVPSHQGLRSDLVDEILWNLRWMLTMQEPSDGGVYHKLTTADFSKFGLMPDADNATRYVVQKSTAAALDLAAVAAYAARLFQADTVALPGFADSCRVAALAAWGWARRNPSVLYNQGALSDPLVATGTYGDGNVSDEFTWAASELFLTTRADSFATAQNLSAAISSAAGLGWSVPSWGGVATLGWLSLQSNKALLTGTLANAGPKLDQGLVAAANAARDNRKSNGYHLPLGSVRWGSTSDYANNGMLLWKAWESTGDTSYRDASLEALDYMLGRNATGYCFVTGFGGKPSMNPHHRASFADGVVAPVPGFLVGGPNGTAGGGDKCTYPAQAAKRYNDGQPCYESNEVAINWNAPLAFLVGVWSARLAATPTSIHGSDRSFGNIEVSHRGNSVVASLSGKQLVRLEVLTPDGRVLARSEGRSSALSVPVDRAGLVVVRAISEDGAAATRAILLP